MKIDTNLIIEGNTITLVPLEMKYKEQLYEAINNPDVWKYTWREVKTFDDIEQMLLIAVQNKDDGKQLPFIVKDKLSGEVIWTTRIGA